MKDAPDDLPKSEKIEFWQARKADAEDDVVGMMRVYAGKLVMIEAELRALRDDPATLEELDAAATQGKWDDNAIRPRPAHDRSIKLSRTGAPFSVPFRVLSEENYKLAEYLVNAYRAGDLVKKDPIA